MIKASDKHLSYTKKYLKEQPQNRMLLQQVQNELHCRSPKKTHWKDHRKLELFVRIYYTNASSSSSDIASIAPHTYFVTFLATRKAIPYYDQM